MGPYDPTESEEALGEQLYDANGAYQMDILGWREMKHREVEISGGNTICEEPRERMEIHTVFKFRMP